MNRAGLLVVTCGLVASARADSEQAMSLGLGYATFSVPGKASAKMAPAALSPTWGWALAASYERAIGTDLALRGELAGGMFFGGNAKDQSARSYAVLGDVGLGFRFDVLNWVPYAFAGLGAVASAGGPIDRGADFVLVVGGGCDKLLNRRQSVGAELRIASFGGDVTVVTVGFRGTVRWAPLL